MTYKCAIIDDEQHGIDILKDLVNSMPLLELVKTYTNPLVAKDEILRGDLLDIVFTDIDMPGINGIELAKLIREKTVHIIFTTAHAGYALESYSVRATDYLLKPISPQKFSNSIGQRIGYTEIKYPTPKIKKEFFIKSNEDCMKKLVKIKLSKLIAIESAKNNLRLHTVDHIYSTCMTLTEIELDFADVDDLIRVNRSFIISKYYIKTIYSTKVEMENDMKISIGDYYKDAFNEYVNANLL